MLGGLLAQYGHYCDVNVPYQVGVSMSKNLEEVSITVAAQKVAAVTQGI